MTEFATTRRGFLAASAAAVGFAASTGSAADASGLRVRRNVKNLAPDGPEMTRLREAFRVLQSRPQTQADSWLAQANHHRYNGQHGNSWFLPWHRAYLFYFEQILRAAANDPSLNLPYWDWSDPASRVVPAAFWTKPLYRVARGVGQEDALPDEYVDPNAVVLPILDTPDWSTFAGAAATAQGQRVALGWLEAGPYNAVHNWIGGAMGLPAWAGQDPLYWLHLANIDRLWVEWVRRNPAAMPTDATWLNQPFNFYGANGQALSVTPSQLLSAEALGYTYEPGATGSTATPYSIVSTPRPRDEAAKTPEKPRLEATPEKAVLGGAAVTVNFELKDDQRDPFKSLLTAKRHPESPAPPDRVVLSLEGLEPPDGPGVLVRVFLNKPDADEGVSFQDPHYAGNASLFVSDAMQAKDQGGTPQRGPFGVRIDVTDALRRLHEAGELKPDQPLSATLVPVAVASRKEAMKEVPFRKVVLAVVG